MSTLKASAPPCNDAVRRVRLASLALGLLPACAVALCTASSACVDVRDYSGAWEGDIATAEEIRVGFTADTRMSAQISAIDLIELSGSMTTSDGQFDASALQPIERTAADALSDLTFSGKPLRTYLLFSEPAAPADATEAWVVLSLFSDDRIELRVMRRNDLFGLFRLSRTKD